MTDLVAYQRFLEAKRPRARVYGAPVDAGTIHPRAQEFQAAVIRWAVEGGRRALFERFGLGKTLQQLEIMRLVLDRNGGTGLIIAPLTPARTEFPAEADALGIPLRFVRTTTEMDAPGLYVTNYESVREGKIDTDHLTAVSLDEAAVLRGFGGTKTFREFMRRFEHTPYRFVATATPSPNEYIELLAYAAFLGIMDVGEAKAQPLDAKVLTPSGWTRMGSIRVGDQVIAHDGTPTRVLGVYPQGERPILRVTFSDGSSTECDAEHLWLTQTQYERNNQRRYVRRNGWDARAREHYATVRTTADIAASLLTAAGSTNHSIPMVGAVRFTERPVEVDPWLLGLLIGDACLRATAVTLSSGDEWIVKRASSVVATYGLHLRRTTVDGCDYGITSTSKQGGNGPGSNRLLASLRALGLLGKRSWEKRVPDVYLANSVKVRLALLQGLMDADGTVNANGRGVQITTTSKGLADDVAALVRSLGGLASVRPIRTTHRDAFVVVVNLPAGMNPFSLPRKATRVRQPGPRALTRYVVSIEPAGVKPAQCIAVEHPERLYVTDDYILTHNTRFFKRNSEKADQLTIHPHKEQEFWLWVNSWAVFLQSPSDLGYSDEGYDLPPMHVEWVQVDSAAADAGVERDGQGKLLRTDALGVVGASREKRATLPARIAKVRELVEAEPDEHVIIWHDLEDERRAIEAAIPGIATVYGSQDLDERETLIADFAAGRIPRLAAKPIMLGSGCNLQRHCARAIYAGVGFKFNDFIQSLHRIFRFLQTRQVRVTIVYGSSEAEVVKELQRKWKDYDALMARMSEIIRTHGLNSIESHDALVRSIGVTREVASGDGWDAVLNDTVLETASRDTNSIDGMILTSIPFGTQYEYTPSYNDFGHTDDDSHFWRQMEFLSPELFRVLAPGRVMAVHVKDRVRPGGMDGLGFQTVSPFHADAIQHYRAAGFAYVGMITIATDVVRENNQTYRLGWSEQCKDGSRMSVGMPEYVLLFRKPPTDRSNGYADTRVVKSKAEYTRGRWQMDAHAFWRSSGNRLLTAAELIGLEAADVFRRFRDWLATTVYDHERVVSLATQLDTAHRLPPGFMLLQPPSTHPDVWTDITRMRTLNGAQEAKGREMHLCPLQFDIVDRLIHRYTNPGELVFDPFGGLMTVPLRALELGRRGLGVELNAQYWGDGVRYLRAAEEKIATPTLFDLDAVTQEAA